MVRPDFSDSMSPASCSTAKWAVIVGFDTGNWSDSSPADIGRSRNSCNTRRRVGSDSALNTLFTVLYLATYLNIVKRKERSVLLWQRPQILSWCSLSQTAVSNHDHERTRGGDGRACRDRDTLGLFTRTNLN